MNKIIFAIGGALELQQTNPIVQQFLTAAGGAEARLVVIPSCIDTEEITQVQQALVPFFNSSGLAEVNFLVPQKGKLNDTAVQSIQNATAVFFSGGSQSQLIEMLNDSAALAKIRQKYGEGELVLAGTSAGCAALSQVMIVRGEQDPVIGKGLGFLPQVILDQHFSSGNASKRIPRLPRLLKAVTQYPQLTGIGVDEDTAAVFFDGEFSQILGRGSVTIVNASQLEPLIQAFTAQSFLPKQANFSNQVGASAQNLVAA